MIDQYNDSPYKPVACSDYDVYEIAIMQKRFIDMTWNDHHGQSQHALIRPKKLHIKDRAEYLLFECVSTENSESQNNNTVRLDQIQRAVIVDN